MTHEFRGATLQEAFRKGQEAGVLSFDNKFVTSRDEDTDEYVIKVDDSS